MKHLSILLAVVMLAGTLTAQTASRKSENTVQKELKQGLVMDALPSTAAPKPY